MISPRYNIFISFAFHFISSLSRWVRTASSIHPVPDCPFEYISIFYGLCSSSRTLSRTLSSLCLAFLQISPGLILSPVSVWHREQCSFWNYLLYCIFVIFNPISINEYTEQVRFTVLCLFNFFTKAVSDLEISEGILLVKIVFERCLKDCTTLSL